MSERDSSEFETSEFVQTDRETCERKIEEWILTGLSPLNKSRGRISNRSSFSLKTNPDFGVILCTSVQCGSC